MNWYKQSQSYKEFATWLAGEINESPNDSKVINEDFVDLIHTWVKETHPFLHQYNYHDALIQSQLHAAKKKRNSDPKEEHRLYLNRMEAETQNVNPDQSEFWIDPRKKNSAIPQAIKNKINKRIHDLGNYHTEIPLGTIFDICKEYGVVALQEDGTKWSGFLIGAKECGSEEARNQHVIFNVAFRTEGGAYMPTRNGLSLSWCKMHSGKYEIVSYLS